MMPFSLNDRRGEFGLADYAMPKDACWQPASMRVDCGVFLSHIQRFLQASVSLEVRMAHAPLGSDYQLRDCDYRVYSVDQHSWVYRQLLTHQFVLPQLQSMAFNIGRRQSSFLSPKLIVCPNAAVGLLLIPVVPVMPRQPDLKQLVRFNYLLHKTDGKSCKISIDRSSSNRRYRSAFCSLRDKKEYPSSDERLARALKLPFDAEQQMALFTMSDLLASLMQGISYSRFNNDVLHVFTYVEVTPDEFASKTSIPFDFTRLTMCINDGYRVTDEQKDKVMRKSTFENVYMGSTASGGAIMTVVDSESPMYLQQFFTSSLQPRYLWIYVMMLMQRHSLLNMTNWLISIGLDGNSDETLQRVRQAVRHMSELTVNNRFSTISDYTQHNSFYHQCCEVQGIDTLYAEVEQKMDTLNDLLEQLSDEKKERIDSNKEFWQAVLAVILAVLTMFSATNDGVEVLMKMGLVNGKNTPYATLVLLLLMLVGVFFVGFKFYRLYNSKWNKNKTRK